MCGDGCARNGQEIKPGVELGGISVNQVIVYNGTKQVVVDTFYKGLTTVARHEDGMMPRTLMGYDAYTGNFKTNIPWSNLSSIDSEVINSFNKIMEERL